MSVLKHILIPVDDIGAAIDFYGRQFGFSLKFRDGDRYAALDGGTVVVALTASSESITGKGAALSIQVDDVDTFVEAARLRGTTILRAVEQGPHERRAVLADPSGQPIVVSSKINHG